MKCYLVDGTGLGSMRAVDRPEPVGPGAGEVLVEVHAVSVNYRDLMVADGRYSGKLDPPIVACSDMAGAVVAVGPEVRQFKQGDRVLNAPFRFWPAGRLRPEWARTFVGGVGVDGVLAERIVYPAESLIKVPDHLDFVQGSTFTIAGLTAWAAVVTHGKVRPGEWVLVHGTGGVSLFGLQIAKLFSANTIMTTGHPEKAEMVRGKTGVDEVLDYRDPAWPDQCRKVTGGGAHVVVEVAGGDSLAKSIQASASGGRIGMIGVLSGSEAKLDVRQILMRQITIRGILMESTEELRALVGAYESAKLYPCVDCTFSFDDAKAAYEYMQKQQHVGKVVIVVRQ